MYKKALVIGGGIAGIQSALDLAEMGIMAVLVESGPSIGGRMAQLDKTFPTNDCAMCILSPRLVEAGSHPYITIMTNSEVVSVEGEAPDFKIMVRKRPRYIDEAKCTGCGICSTKCPVRITDAYNKGLSRTKCIHIPFPQAVPAIPIIDRQSCLYFKTGKCRLCEKSCEMKAIDFAQKERVIEVEAGSIILASGSQEFDARLKNEYGYKLFPNVLSSIEFERMLSASGPTSGHVLRPSDQKAPKKLAILQCVGSRDLKSGNDHCSAVCCMQASKDAIVAQEHLPGLQTTVFYIDIRAYGKGFDAFVERAQKQYKARFICGRVSSVELSEAGNDDLTIQYVTPNGKVHREDFDMLVASVGLEPTRSAKELAGRLGIRTDIRGFIETGSFSPVSTNRSGIFACGSISGPKDIPESVIEASGASSAAAACQGALPSKKIVTEFPAEKDIRGESPRVGVFVCRCGINIASVVDVPSVVEYAAALPGVAHAQELLFACAQDSQKTIKETLKAKGINRLVVAACTPRTHEPLFQKTLKEIGINPYLFEFANVREQCAWVHQKEPREATAKAKDLVRGSVHRVVLAEQLHRKTLTINRDALVIGGGLAGMTAALDLAGQGFTVHLVEKEKELGGNLRHVRTTLKGEKTSVLLDDLRAGVESSARTKLHLGAGIKEISGFIGNFTTVLTDGSEIKHGACIVATGGEEYRPSEYCYGQSGRIITQRELEDMLETPDAAELRGLRDVVMIQCVGSRDGTRSYCSRVCCAGAIKNSISIKEMSPATNVHVLYRDIRTYGLRERYYRTARDKGVVFCRYDKDKAPRVVVEKGEVSIRVRDEIAGKELLLSPDILVLSVGVVPNGDNKALSQQLKVPLDGDGFFLEAHMKLRPVDFATDGVFVCGLAHYPKDIGETIAQARAAAGRAATVLSKTAIESEGKISYVRRDRCTACGVCRQVCTYGAIEIDQEKRTAVVNESLCKGCGACSASCRSAAIDIKGFRDEQILMGLKAL
jgi:heterodisulfide reductase subunit A